MKNNTVVTASDINYLWGVFMLIASMRKAGMDEPVIVFAKDYDARAKRIVEAFGDVRVVDAPPSSRSMTCRKPEAMLLADTDFVTWADCDAFFTENCSELLPPPDNFQMRVRRRGADEALAAGLSVRNESGGVEVAPFMAESWKVDVGELSVSRFDTCCSACFLSAPATCRDFLKRWQTQMEKVLPEGDVGVVDRRVRAYFQTDESVLNSLLCFMRDAPKIVDEYVIDRLPHFVHFIGQPKPWNAWTRRAFRFFDSYVSVLEWAVSKKMELPSREIPFSLRRRNKKICKFYVPISELAEKLKKIPRKLSAKFRAD